MFNKSFNLNFSKRAPQRFDLELNASVTTVNMRIPIHLDIFFILVIKTFYFGINRFKTKKQFKTHFVNKYLLTNN